MCSITSRKKILVAATLDSKGDAVRLLCERIEELGHTPITLDLGIMDDPPFEPTISSAEVAIAGGGSAADVRGETGDRHVRLRMMTDGAIRIAGNMAANGEINGIVGVGGMSNAAIISAICQSLPIGIPKIILSCAAGMSKYNLFGRSDIAVVATVFDTDYMNDFLRQSVVKTAHMICGAVASESVPATRKIDELRESGNQIVAINQFFSHRCVSHLLDVLEARGDVAPIVFHSNGVGDMVMEDLIVGGAKFDAVVDLCVAGVSERLMGGNRAAGPNRLEGAAQAGIPQIVLPTALDYISCGPLSRRDDGDALWQERQLAERKLWIQDEMRVQVKVTADEAVEIASAVAAKLNKASAPVKFLVPLRGCDVPNKSGEALHEPVINELLIETLKEKVDPEVVEFREYDLYLDTPEFASVIDETLQEICEPG